MVGDRASSAPVGEQSCRPHSRPPPTWPSSDGARSATAPRRLPARRSLQGRWARVSCDLAGLCLSQTQGAGQLSCLAMDSLPPPLQLSPAVRKRRTDAWRGRALRLLGAVTVHLLPLALLVSALPTRPKDLGGAFGQSVAVTVVSGAPRAAAAAAQPKPPSFAGLEQRLSHHAGVVAAPPPRAQAAAPTSLSDLFDRPSGAPGQVAAKGAPQQAMGGDDDPFARASVSYRGDDPAKAARLRSKAQTCARGAKALRLLCICIVFSISF